jgi:ABC-type transport system involved in multi-copper enzyme maturation permease subunit
MNGALLRKELRELLPWGVLSVALGVFDLLFALFTQLDMRPLSQTYAGLGDAGSVLFWFIAFAIGTGLATREHDDRTLAFLDGLPVSRSRIFFTKMLVAFGLVMLAPVVRFTLAILLHLLSSDSLQRALNLDLLLLIFAQHALAMCTGLLLGAALGRLRSLTWLAFGCLAVVLLMVIDRIPQAAMLDPTSILDVRLQSGRIRFDAAAVNSQLVLCVIAGYLAWRGFTRVHRPPILNLDLLTRPVVSAIVSTLTIAVVFLAVYLVANRRMYEGAPSGDEIVLDRSEPRFPASAPAQMQTRHFRFSYLASEANAAREVAARADDIFERVHQLLGVPVGALIQVDTSGSATNTHGTAHFGRIRMRLNDEAALTLAHETAHVVADRVAGNERAWLWDAAPALNEGLATWVHSQFGATEEQLAGRFALAALHSRRELIVEEFADPEALSRLRDENIKYPMGEAMIAATAKLYGTDAVPNLLRAFASPKLPTDLRGITLWQAVFQVAGMDLGAVTDEFYREVAAERDEHAGEIAQLPRARARVVVNGEAFGVQVLTDRPLSESQSLHVRFKPEPDSDLDDIDAQRAEPNVPVWRNSRWIRGGAICVQPGVMVAPMQVLFEPWTCLPTADASEWEGAERGKEFEDDEGGDVEE